MTVTRYAILALILGLLASCGAPKPKDGPPPTDIDDVAFREHLRILSGDDYEGREPGSKGEEKTLAYLTEQFKKLNLKPGNQQSFTQAVPLLKLTASGRSFSYTSAQGTANLTDGRDVVLYSKRSDSELTLAQSPLVFAGYGVVAPEYSWNDYAGIDVHGKTVLLLVSDPGPAAHDPTLFKGNAMSAYGGLAYKLQEAGRQGAAAVLLIHDPAALGYGWSAVQNRWGRAVFKAQAENDVHPAIEGWLQADAARSLLAASGSDLAALTASAAKPGFKAVLLSAKADLRLHNTVQPVSSANFLALLPGGRHKDEYVIYDAHWDSLGADPTQKGHGIFNGATDNATGLAGLLVLAKSFVHTDPKPDRSILFLATTAGEPDHLGAEYYLKNPIFPIAQTAAAIDVDTLLVGGRTRDLSILGWGSSDLEETAVRSALRQGRQGNPDPFASLGLYYSSEAYVFAHHGIPALYAVAGIDDSARGPAYGRARRQDFLARNLWQTSDQYGSDWDVRGAVDDLTLCYDVGLNVARNLRFPRWKPNSEFRATHGAQRAPEAP